MTEHEPFTCELCQCEYKEDPHYDINNIGPYCESCHYIIAIEYQEHDNGIE